MLIWHWHWHYYRHWLCFSAFFFIAGFAPRPKEKNEENKAIANANAKLESTSFIPGWGFHNHLAVRNFRFDSNLMRRDRLQRPSPFFKNHLIDVATKKAASIKCHVVQTRFDVQMLFFNHLTDAAKRKAASIKCRDVWMQEKTHSTYPRLFFFCKRIQGKAC